MTTRPIHKQSISISSHISVALGYDLWMPVWRCRKNVLSMPRELRTIA